MDQPRPRRFPRTSKRRGRGWTWTVLQNYARNFWVINSVQVIMAVLITEFAGKSPDFLKAG